MPVVIEQMEKRLFLDASQLTETIDASTLPTSVSDRVPLVGSMTMTVTNNSGANQTERTLVGFLISNGPLDVPSRAYGVLKSQTIVLPLNPGQSRTFKFSINIPKGKLADGTDTITAVAVEPGGAYSQSAPGPTLTVHPPIIALSETENILKLPANATTGSKFTITDRVAITNSGSDPSTDPLTIGIYASPDGIPADGKLMTTVKRSTTIKAGGTVTIPVAISAIPALSAGTYKIVTQVTQADGTITATDPATAPEFTLSAPTSGVHFNDSIRSQTPVYSSLPLDGAVHYLSQITFLEAITNTGTAASGEDSFKLFASNSPTFDSSAVQIGGTFTLDLGTIPHKGLRTFNVQFNTDLSGISFDGHTAVSEYLIIQITDPTGGLSTASTASPVKLFETLG